MPATEAKLAWGEKDKTQDIKSVLYVDNGTPVASFTKEVNSRLAKRPLKINGRLANHGLTSLIKEATGIHFTKGLVHN